MPSAHRRIRLLLILFGCLMCSTACFSCASLHAAEQTYAPDDKRDIANPERGLYIQFTSQAEQNPLELNAVKQLHDQNMTLILRMYYLKTFLDRPLSDKQLEMIRNDFAIMREAGVKCILRFAYSEEIGKPDAPIDVVLKHMEQLAPIIKDNADVILTAQGGFVGAWGEWHASTNDLAEPPNAKKIVNKWLDILPPNRTVQLRTPRQKWMILDSKEPITASQAFTDTPIARIGHHNDCFISSDTDVGTYEDIEKEKQYLGIETQFVPMGGETCAISKFSDTENARKEMENLHFTYLNLGYHPEVIKKWKNDGFFQEVKRRLGYRLSLQSFEYPPSTRPYGKINIGLTLENTGFAAPVNPRDVVLIMVNQQDKKEFSLKISCEPRRWLPGKPIRIEEELQLPRDMPSGIYKLYLTLPDPALADNPAYMIQLANPGIYDAKTGRHDLNATIKTVLR